MLRIGIIRWRHLNEIRTNEVESIQPAEDRSQLASGPATCFWCASSGRNYHKGSRSALLSLIANQVDLVRTSWVESINVNRDIHRVRGADPVPDLLNDAINTCLIPPPRARSALFLPF
jgi:hypothetical protein